MLDPAFVFSQQSLSDFQDCPRRFYLRYIARRPWPAPLSAPAGMDAQQYEAHLRHGARLHRWIERHWLGIPPQSPAISDQSSAVSGQSSAVSEQPLNEDAELMTWWRRFLATDFSDLPPQRLPELVLIAALGNYRVYARYDLLALPTPPPAPPPQGEGSKRAVIVDWKTSRSRAVLNADSMRRRLQTRVYLYVLVTAGAVYNGGAPFAPGECRMRYWLASFPEQPWVEVGYSDAEYQADHERLLALASDIGRRSGEDQFPKTDDERQCAYCAYRALCRRAVVPGAAPVFEDAADGTLVADEVAELDY